MPQDDKGKCCFCIERLSRLQRGYNILHYISLISFACIPGRIGKYSEGMHMSQIRVIIYLVSMTLPFLGDFIALIYLFRNNCSSVDIRKKKSMIQCELEQLPLDQLMKKHRDKQYDICT